MASQELVDVVVELESAVWQALVDGNAAADRALLADHFLGVYPTGFADRADHTDQLSSGPTVAEYSILSPRVLEVTDADVLLSYEAHFRRTSDGSLERMYVSSLWSRRDDQWLNAFSQDTPAIDETR